MPKRSQSAAQGAEVETSQQVPRAVAPLRRCAARQPGTVRCGCTGAVVHGMRRRIDPLYDTVHACENLLGIVTCMSCAM